MCVCVSLPLSFRHIRPIVGLHPAALPFVAQMVGGGHDVSDEEGLGGYCH